MLFERQVVLCSKRWPIVQRCYGTSETAKLLRAVDYYRSGYGILSADGCTACQAASQM
jgi:hypothetical protein